MTQPVGQEAVGFFAKLSPPTFWILLPPQSRALFLLEPLDFPGDGPLRHAYLFRDFPHGYLRVLPHEGDDGRFGLGERQAIYDIIYDIIYNKFVS